VCVWCSGDISEGLDGGVESSLILEEEMCEQRTVSLAWLMAAAIILERICLLVCLTERALL
jgi:hypothetical protein